MRTGESRLRMYSESELGVFPGRFELDIARKWDAHRVSSSGAPTWARRVDAPRVTEQSPRRIGVWAERKRLAVRPVLVVVICPGGR